MWEGLRRMLEKDSVKGRIVLAKRSRHVVENRFLLEEAIKEG